MADMRTLEKIAIDCRLAAAAYNETPGLAGYGANAETICDIYLGMARLAEAVAAITAGNSDKQDVG